MNKPNLIYKNYNKLINLNFLDQFIRFNGTFPPNAVQGGYEGTVKLFVGRKTIDGKNLLGKVADTLKIIYVPYFAKEYEFDDDFDILILR